MSSRSAEPAHRSIQRPPSPRTRSKQNLSPVSSALLLFVILLTADRLRIFLVGYILHPLDVLAIEGLLHGDVHHPGVRPRAMPVLLTGRNPHRIAGLDFADRPAFRLHAPHAGNHVQRLTKR